MQQQQESGSRDSVHEHVTASAQTTEAQKQRRSYRSAFLLLSIALVILVVTGIAFAQVRGLVGRDAGTPQTFAHASGWLQLTSSGMIDATGTTGINDGVSIMLQGMPVPPSGQTYSAWFLPGSEEMIPLLLGQLSVHAGKASLSYQDAQHRNLLALYSAVVVSTHTTYPIAASWCLWASYPTQPSPSTGMSALDHLRHLLAQERDLQAYGLSGGLAFWFAHNTEKIEEWASAAQGDGMQTSPDTHDIHRQMLRILDDLDGMTQLATDQLPVNSLVDQQQAEIGLLPMPGMTATSSMPAMPGMAATPLDYTDLLETHLNNFLQSPEVPMAQQHEVSQIEQSILMLRAQLQTVHDRALTIFRLTGPQLRQEGLPLLDALLMQTLQAAYGADGGAQILIQIEQLAVLALHPYNA